MKKLALLATVVGITANSAHAFQGRAFRAEGEHTCWSRWAVGYKCRVSGQNYADCHHARQALQYLNCCNQMFWGMQQMWDGASTDFRITYCTM